MQKLLTMVRSAYGSAYITEDLVVIPQTGAVQVYLYINHDGEVEMHVFNGNNEVRLSQEWCGLPRMLADVEHYVAIVNEYTSDDGPEPPAEITSDHRISIRGGAHTIKVTQEMRWELGIAEGDKVVVTIHRRPVGPDAEPKGPKWISWMSVLKIRGNAHTISIDREIREDMGLADGDWVTVTLSRSQ
jgi:hypothetical protein